MHTESSQFTRPAAWPALAIAAALVLLLGTWLSDPLAQDPAYHLFVDQRSLLDIPHANDVLSNLPFCLVGLAGLCFAWRARGQLGDFTAPYLVFFSGVLLTGLGSAWYHFAPANSTLVWDRLPMAIAFMGLVTLLLAERIAHDRGRQLLPWLVLAGIASVAYWHFTDDLRPYLLVQFGSMALLPCLLLGFRRAGDRYLWFTLGFYVIAKLLEIGDGQVYALTGEWVSGHSLKHLAAALATLMILLRLRQQARLAAPTAGARR